jgi:Ran GTPase-activating protein (RanGAP) involved in mRNA processing and transport
VRQQTDVWKNSLRHSPLDMDCKAISQRHPKSLKRLIICNNNLRDAGVTILFDLLIEQPGLIGLDLQFNSLTEVIGQKSILLLKANRELCILDLRNNLIGKDWD